MKEPKRIDQIIAEALNSDDMGVAWDCRFPSRDGTKWAPVYDKLARAAHEAGYELCAKILLKYIESEKINDIGDMIRVLRRMAAETRRSKSE